MKKIIFGLTVLAISLNAQSAPTPPKPNHCPSIESVRSMGFDIINKDATNTWSVWKLKMAYDTNAIWDMGIGISAKNSNEASQKAKAILSTSGDLEGPEISDDQSYWVCYAMNIDQNGEYSVVATSTPGQYGKLSLIKR